MFKKFSKEDNITNTSKVKSSVARGIRSKICEAYPWLEESGVIEVIFPKKENVILAKCQNHVQIVYVKDKPIFFSNREGYWFPTLRILHQYPQMMPRLRADTGAIKHVLSGAHIMCPGLTSPGATIHDEVDSETPVAIYAENKEYAMAIGITVMTTEEMRKINKGIGVELTHYLNDGLWKLQS